ncbi:MAG: channel protein TolC [Betaproteobacteria bacterium]|nr:MAG: channel protein TolC [Betaproteobacteria bacterium]
MNISQYVYALLIFGVTLHTPLNASDLMDIYRDALEQDAEYAAARAKHKAAQEKLPQGRAGLLPTLTLSGVRRRQLINTNRGPEVTIDNTSLVITAIQPLFRMENFVAYQQSKIQVMQADSQFIIAAQDLILRVAQAYFDVLIAQLDVRVVKNQKKAISQQLRQAKGSFEAGTSTIVDTYEAQARFDLTVSREIVARNAFEVSKRKLQKIIGRFPDNLARMQESDLDLFVLKYDSMEDWLTVAEQNSLTIRVQQAVYEIAKKEVERARAGHYPTLDLVALYSDQEGVGGAITGRGIDLTSKEIGLRLNFPIFSGFAVQSRVREALANQERVFQDMKNTRRNTALQVSQQYLNVTNGTALVRALRQAVISSKSQFESTKLGQEVGVRIEVDVLNAQQLYSVAQRDLGRAYYNFFMSRLRLKAEAGELDEEDLRQVNKTLE